MTTRRSGAFTRRRLLEGSIGLGTGGALVLAGCGGKAAAPRAPATSGPGATSYDAPGPTRSPGTPTAVRPGGTARIMSPRAFGFDTFDALRSGDPSTLEVLARTHSRLLNWTDFEHQIIAPDLAASWEQPEPGVWLFRINQAARWPDSPPDNGQPVTAGDVAAHLTRAVQIASSTKLPLIQRQADYLSMRAVTTPGPGLVRVETVAPDPFLLHTLAGRFALVQSPSAVAMFGSSGAGMTPEQSAGSGPLIYGGLRDGALNFVLNPYAITSPGAAAIDVLPPGDPVHAYNGFGATQVLTRDRRDSAALEAAGATAVPCFEEQPIVLACFVGAPPWDDARLLRALSGALNRDELSRRLFGGRAAPAGPLAPVFGQFASSEASLALAAGFRGSRDIDAREARALWTAAGGPALGPVTIDFPSIFDPLYSAGSTVTGMLNEALGGLQFRPAVETYTTISKKAADHAYGSGQPSLWFGWGPSFVEPDPSRWLIETYSSRRGTGRATTGFVDAATDDALDAVAAEFDLRLRRQLAATVSGRLLAAAGGGILNLLVQRGEVFTRPGWAAPPPIPWPAQHLAYSIRKD